MGHNEEVNATITIGQNKNNQRSLLKYIMDHKAMYKAKRPYNPKYCLRVYKTSISVSSSESMNLNATTLKTRLHDD